MLTISIPITSTEWERYYDLRFTVLREPWGQLKGSEVLKDEDQAEHVMVVDSETNEIVGVARMQTNSPTQGQVRCVAVSPIMQGKGIGKIIMQDLIKNNSKIVLEVLKVNERAIAFYQALNFEIMEDLEVSFRMKLK